VDTWRDDSVCATLSWEERAYFFGDDPVLGTHKQHEMARMQCYKCPVQIECMKWCIEEDMFWGVWGGLTESQRKRYLMPAIRKDGFSDSVIQQVLLERGLKILRLIETEE
jgi:WhiB family redox-sensing transcriptional regulator